MSEDSEKKILSDLPGPNVLEYDDFRRFLKDYFFYRNQRNRRYTHNAFARHLGLNRTLVRLILSGDRNLTSKHIEHVARVCQLSGEYAGYFFLLVRCSQEEDILIQSILKSALDEHRKKIQSNLS